MLRRVFSYDLILARQIYLDKTGLLIFILFILGFLSPPSPALLTYGGISFAQLGGFGVFFMHYNYEYCRPISILLLTDKVN